MPKTTFQRIIFTLTGVLLMATTMATFNNYLVYGAFSAELWKQVGIAFCQKAPLAFLLQFFVVQKWAAKQAAKYPTDNQILYSMIRVGHTAVFMAPVMCVYSNIINVLQFHWGFGKFLEAVVTKLPINWLFAVCIQVVVLSPLNKAIFRALFKKQLAAEKQTVTAGGGA